MKEDTEDRIFGIILVVLGLIFGGCAAVCIIALGPV